MRTGLNWLRVNIPWLISETGVPIETSSCLISDVPINWLRVNIPWLISETGVPIERSSCLISDVPIKFAKTKKMYAVIIHSIVHSF